MVFKIGFREKKWASQLFYSWQVNETVGVLSLG